MAKKSIGIMIAVLLFAFSIFAGSFEIGGGITYDQFNYNSVLDTEDFFREDKAPYDAFVFNINGTYWFTEKMGVEAGFDFSKGTMLEYEGTVEGTFEDSNDTYTSSEKEKITSQVMGPSAKFKYRVLQTPVVVDLKVGGGYYFYKFESKVEREYYDKYLGEEGSQEADEQSGSGFGMLIGADIVNPITDKLSMTANVGYKLFTKVSNLKDIDGKEIKDTTLSLNGLKLGLGVVYAF